MLSRVRLRRCFVCAVTADRRVRLSRYAGSRTYFRFMTIVIWMSPIGPLAARFSVITLPSGE